MRNRASRTAGEDRFISPYPCLSVWIRGSGGLVSALADWGRPWLRIRASHAASRLISVH